MSPARQPVRQRPAPIRLGLVNRLRLSIARGDAIYASPTYPGAALIAYRNRPKRRSLRSKAAISAFLLIAFVALYYFDYFPF